MPLRRRKNDNGALGERSDREPRQADDWLSPESAPGETPPARSRSAARSARGETMIPARASRPALESVFMRVVATAGIVGICVALAAILASQDVQGWIIGAVVSTISVVLAAILWSARAL
jgi:hypothetical protein